MANERKGDKAIETIMERRGRRRGGICHSITEKMSRRNKKCIPHLCGSIGATDAYRFVLRIPP
jgi:hypothetical protein